MSWRFESILRYQYSVPTQVPTRGTRYLPQYRLEVLGTRFWYRIAKTRVGYPTRVRSTDSTRLVYLRPRRPNYVPAGALIGGLRWRQQRRQRLTYPVRGRLIIRAVAVASPKGPYTSNSNAVYARRTLAQGGLIPRLNAGVPRTGASNHLRGPENLRYTP